MGDVKISVSGISGITPIGVSMSFAVNAIPVCKIAMDPTDSSLLQDPDAQKRKGQVTVSCVVNSPDVQDQVNFVGLFDGISFNYSFGSVSFDAIIKSNFQILLETFTKIPGLNAMGLNPFQRINTLIRTDDAGGVSDQTGIGDLILASATLSPSSYNSIEYYLEVVKAALKVQTSGDIDQLVGADSSDITTIMDLLKMGEYKSGAQKALNMIQSQVNTDAISDVSSSLAASLAAGSNFVLSTYLANSDVLWENMLQFYNLVGCNLIASTKNVYVVPNNGFIAVTRPQYTKGGRGGPNAAMPSNYNQVGYSDNGYKDIGYVAVVNDSQQSGMDLLGTRPMFCGGYPASGGSSLSPSSGLLVVRAHPFMFYDSASFINAANYQERNKKQTGLDSNYKTQTNYAGGKSNPVPTLQKGSDALQSNLKDIGDNYAEIKFYQARYGDRTGQIVMDFNSQWAPGTCGTVYLKGPNVWIDFFVESVTHEIAISAPTNGTAITIISFSCGRLGATPINVASDKFYNYDSGKMTAVTSGFIGDLQ